jgi:hypothetical protein
VSQKQQSIEYSSQKEKSEGKIYEGKKEQEGGKKRITRVAGICAG